MEKKPSAKRKRKYRMSLRLHFTVVSVLTLCTACVIATAIVVGGIMHIYDGEFTMPIVISCCLLICFITMALGGGMLFAGMKMMTEPVSKVSQLMRKIAKGDYSVRVPYKKGTRKKYLYANELDELRENLNYMAQELDGKDRMQKEFISNVSHELKTPVAAIHGFTEILMDGGLRPEQQVEYIEILHQEAERLSNLYENMLIISKVDNQSIIEKKDWFRLDEQLRKCMILITEKWMDKQIEFEPRLESVIIQSNADFLIQVWMNLLENAVKYSGDYVRIWVTIESEDGLVKVTITDNGIGIGSEKLERIFDRFYQCEESHKQLGSGLGLSIVKRILELLSGKIEVYSESGKGMKVIVKL